MLFPPFLTTRLGLFPRPASRNKTPAADRRLRPMLEALEDRWVPSTLTVTTSADSGAGSLRAEISAAKSGDTIVFDPKLDGQTITLTSGELLISKPLTITGPGAGQLTVSGNNSSRVFEVTKTTKSATISGLTINNGNAGSGYDGGGIENEGGLKVSGCTVSANSAGQGGGIGNESGSTLTVTNCIVSGNHNGGILNWGTLTISGSTLSSNVGYGIENSGYTTSSGSLSGGTATISGSTVSNNSWGAAIYNANSMSLSNCTISNNDNNNWGRGGGIFNGNGSLTVSNCTISNNTAGFGAGIYVQDGTVTVTGSTMTQNTANDNGAGYGGYGGGIYVEGRYGTSLTLSGSNVTSNTADYGGGVYVEAGATVTVKNYSRIINNLAPSGFVADDVYNLGVLYADSTSINNLGNDNGNQPILI